MSRRWTRITELWLLPAALALITVGDGILHLRLNYLLNGGMLWGKLSFHGGGRPAGPPPGGPPPGAHGATGHPPTNPLPLPLNEMFTLNFLAAVGLAEALIVAINWLPRWVALVDLALIAFAAASIYGWWQMGKPNPQGLGHISKVLEIVIIVLALVEGVLAARLLRPHADQRRAAGGDVVTI